MTDATFWDKVAPKYAQDPIEDMAGYEATLERMRAYLQPEHSVLELGCGTGSTALLLADQVARYLGTDLSPAMVDIARSKLDETTPPGLSFSVSPADALPDGHFDVILGLNLFHLVPDLEAVLSRIFAALPPGGLLIHKTGLIKDGKWFLGLAIPIMRAIGKAPFVRNLSATEFRALLRQAGFEPVEEIVQPGTAPRMFTVSRKPLN